MGRCSRISRGTPESILPLRMPSLLPHDLCHGRSSCSRHSISVFPNESTLHIRWPKDWSFSFSTSPSNEYQGLISFRIDCPRPPCCPRDSQESSPTPQCNSINSSVHSLLYGPTLTSVHDYWKNQSFVSQVMSLLFNTLSRFVIAFFPPRSKRLLIPWLQSSAVILKPKKIKSVTISIFFPFICHEVMGLDAIILVF